MPSNCTILKVFVASPSDVKPERDALASIIAEFNQTWGDSHNIRLELIGWETHTFPAIGEDAQDVVNKQIGDNYDIFLGIMWGRFGTSTGRFDSGTEEEFNRAIDRLNLGERLEIMFYFKVADIPYQDIDPEQFNKVKVFKVNESKRKGVYYHEFRATDEFVGLVRVHLSKVVQAWLLSNQKTDEVKTRSEATTGEEPTFNPLANLAAIQGDDEDDDIFELVERGSEGSRRVIEIVSRMTYALERLGSRMNEHVENVRQLSGNGERTLPPKVAKQVSNATASDLEYFVSQMSADIPEFHKQNSLFMESFGRVAMLSRYDSNLKDEDVRPTYEQLLSYRSIIVKTRSQLSEFRQTLSNLPRMTGDFNRARRRAGAVMDDMIVQLDIGLNQADTVVELLGQLLD